jgi:hypothetical protein
MNPVEVFDAIFNNNNIYFCIEPSEDGMEPVGRSVLVVLKTLNKVVDRMEFYAGQIYYLLWSPDGRQIGEISTFLEHVTLLTDIAWLARRALYFAAQSFEEVYT